MLRRVLLTITAARPNPVFDAELRRWRLMGRFPDQLRFAQTVVYGLPILSAMGWAAFQTLSGRLTMFSSSVLIALVTLLLGTTVVVDAVYALITVGTFNTEIQQGQWDLLRLTPLLPEQIYAAKFSIAQLRVFRWMVVEAGVRVLCLSLLLLEIALQTVRSIVSYPLYLPSIWLNTLILLILFPLLYMFVMEPFWRMRTMVAIGCAASARVEQRGGALFMALAGAFMLRLVQIGAIAGIILQLLAASERFERAFLYLCGLPLFAPLLLYFTTHWLYGIVRRRLLQSTYTYLFSPH